MIMSSKHLGLLIERGVNGKNGPLCVWLRMRIGFTWFGIDCGSVKHGPNTAWLRFGSHEVSVKSWEHRFDGLMGRLSKWIDTKLAELYNFVDENLPTLSFLYELMDWSSSRDVSERSSGLSHTLQFD